MDKVATKLDEGVHDVSRDETSVWILQAGGSVSRSDPRLGLAELVNGTPEVQPQLSHVSRGQYALLGDGI